MKTSVLSKLLALAVLLAILLPAASAQMSDGRVRFGLKAGISAANFTKSEFEDRQGRFGFVGGAFAKLPLGKKNLVSLRPELLFVMKGATAQNAGAADVDFKLNYLELPLSLEFNPLAIFNLHAGVQAATLISSVDERFDLNKLDAGWHVGGGIDLGNIGLHVRYNSSFLNLFNDADNDTRNWNLTVTGAYSFQFSNAQ